MSGILHAVSSQQKKVKSFFILDGTSFAYRSFFAIQHLSTSQGLPTNAVYGFARTLQKVLSEQKPDYIAVAFDRVEPTFRHEQFKAYKAHRPSMPQELVSQLPLIQELLEAYRIPVLEVPGYEADDIMGTLVTRARKLGIRAILLTGDKDMLQFVEDQVQVMSTAKEGLLYDPKAVAERYGVQPKQIPQMLALTGDSSDNIPGIPGVGPKTAANLLQQFGDINGIYENLAAIKSPSLRSALEASKQMVGENLSLVQVRTDVPISMAVQDCQRKEPDREKLADLFKRLEFSALLKDWIGQSAEPAGTAAIVQDPKDMASRLSSLSKAGSFVFDLLTTSMQPMQAEILGAMFAAEGQEGFYVTLGDTLPQKEFIRQSAKLLEDPSIGKIGHDLKYDATVLLHHGISLKGICFDTMLASYLLNPSKLHHGLGEIALEFSNEKISTLSEILGKGKTARSMTDLSVQELAQFAAGEASVIGRLHKVLLPLLESKQLQALFADVEIPLETVLARMEYTGIRVDPEILTELSKEFSLQIEDTTRQIYALAGETFNIASPKELAHVLFEKLKLPVHRRTKTGYSTDMDVLTSLARTHELPQLVLNYRTLMKLKSTYSDVLPTLMHPQTGRIHTSFNQTVTATGRLSSSDPNLQNIPVKTPMGLRIRSAFVPGDRQSVLLGADYSQIELRILAHFSKDENLQEAFRQDQDVHRHTAGLVFGIAAKDVVEEQRRKAKVVNFGILYGMGAFGLAKDMGVTQNEAQDFIDAYFARYPGVKDFIAEVLVRARREKCVTTILGRRRYVPEISSANFSLRQFAERTAVNTVVQGSAADIIKMAMLGIDKELSSNKWKARMLLQIHDELVFEVAAGQVQKFTKMVRQHMENVVGLNVPLKVDIKTGENWAEL